MSQAFWGKVLLEDQHVKKYAGAIIYYQTSAPPPARSVWKYKVLHSGNIEAVLDMLRRSKYIKILYIVRVYAKNK